MFSVFLDVVKLLIRYVVWYRLLYLNLFVVDIFVHSIYLPKIA